jgi:Tfp pilus assembly protein FimT
MDVDHKIQNLKKLIITAEGETLDYLVEQLHTLLTKQRAERQARELENQLTQADTEPVAAGTCPPSLEVKEKHSALKIVGINNNVLKDMSSGRNGRFHASSNSLRQQEPNTGKIPILHDFRIHKSDGA